MQFTTDGSLLEGFRREPCPGREGCELLTPEWGTGLIDMRVGGGYSHAEGGGFYFVRTTPPNHWEQWAVDQAGTPLFGLRSIRPLEDRCYHGAFDFDGDRVAFVVSEPDGDRYSFSWVFAGTWTEAGVTLQNFGRLDSEIPRASHFHDVRVGEARIALESAPSFSITDVTWSGEAAIVGDFRDGGQTYISAVIDDTLIYDVYGTPHHIRAAIGGARGEVLIDPTGAEASAVVTDGVDIAWIQAYGRDVVEFERLELWASPYANQAARIEPRLIADVAGTNPRPDTVMGFGYVAVKELGPTIREVIRVYRLSDGASATISPPGESVFWDTALFIGPETIGVAVGIPGSPPRDESVMIIRLDSLTFAPRE